MKWFKYVVANWRTSLPALVTLAGVEVALSGALSLPPSLTKGCGVVLALGTALGLLNAADARRLADMESAIAAMGVSK